VRVRPAHSDRVDADQDFTWPGDWDGTLLELNVPGAPQHRSPHHRAVAGSIRCVVT